MADIRRVQRDEWDSFVESSPQGTIFSKSIWLDLFDADYNIWGYYKNNNLLGGTANFELLNL